MKPSIVLAALLSTWTTASLIPSLRRNSVTTLLHSSIAATDTDNDNDSGSGSESSQGGAVLSAPNVALVRAEFTIPVPEMPTTGPTAGDVAGLYAVSLYVGIDSAASCAGALSAGVDVFWDEGTTTADAWFQWYPGGASDVGGFAIAPGDRLRVTAEATTAAGDAGRVVFEQLGNSTGTGVQGGESEGGGEVVLQSVTQTFANQTSALCLAQAAWIVADFADADGVPDGEPVALANFSSDGVLSFDALTVQNSSGDAVSAAGAAVLDIDLSAQGGQLTDCGLVADGTGVQCVRVVGGES